MRRAVLFAVLLAAACATAPRLEPPKVGVARVTLDRFGGASAQFTIVLALSNPNDREIAVDAAAADLRVENVVVGSARLAAPVRLPAHGETTATLAARTDLPSTLQAAAELTRRLSTRPEDGAALRYTISGTATIDGGSVIPFSRSGEIGR
ncbi:MAG: LEA type 2 family protein [Burkholderiales bacterium]|nr:LEA type 2 family protein [Burkholderiales bacterium]